MVIAQGAIWWTDFGEPRGSGPAYMRPAVIIQSDDLNDSHIGSTVVVPLTSNLRFANMPFSVVLRSGNGKPDRTSLANAAQVQTVDKSLLIEFIGRVSKSELAAIFRALDVVLGR